MSPRKKNGRAAAEAAYADLLKDNTTLVGDVGEAWDGYLTKLDDAAAARDRYEDARAAAIKAGAITNDQLDALNYKKTTKLPAAPGRVAAPAAAHTVADHVSPPQHTNGATPASALASVGARPSGANYE